MRAAPAERPARWPACSEKSASSKRSTSASPRASAGADPVAFAAALRAANAGRGRPNDGGDANYYFAYGAAPRPGAAGGAFTRYYVNLDGAGAARLVASVTRALEDARVPFSLKCFPTRTTTTAATAQSCTPTAGTTPRSTSALLRACTAKIAPFLRDATPLLTQRLGPGSARARRTPSAKATASAAAASSRTRCSLNRRARPTPRRVLETAAELERRGS